MKRIQLLLIGFVLAIASLAQNAEEPKEEEARKEYRATATKINDLVNTKLDAKFDYDKTYMYGKVWITLKPHFYPTDSLTLDAKGMDIHKVALIQGNTQKPLQYKYDGLSLRIDLDKTYKANERYTVFIDYTSKPNEFKVHGSMAITDAKGLYFINPHGTEKNKPHRKSGPREKPKALLCGALPLTDQIRKQPRNSASRPLPNTLRFPMEH